MTHARRGHTYETVNTHGTRNLLGAARMAGVGRFLHVSSRAIDAAGGPYSSSKAEAERLVRESKLPYSIVRLPELYGSGSREGVDDIVSRARAGRPIFLVGDGSDEVCPVALEEAVAALAAALSSDAAVGKTYTLGGECMTLRRLAERCTAAFESRSRIVGVPVTVVAALSLLARVAPLPLYPDQLARLRAPKPAPDEAARVDLAFRPRPLEEALGSQCST